MRYSENCIYAVETPLGIKIGFTSRLGDRLSVFQKEHKKICYPLALIKGLTRKQAMKLEKGIHHWLREDAVGGEYFNTPSHIVEGVFVEFEKYRNG